ncbi:helix-turn-helix domain-containing protein [Halobacteriales archaeon Cl-PHB]
MSPGIRATVEFPPPTVCPVAELSAAAETTVDAVTTSVCDGDCGGSVTEFALDADHDPGVDAEPVFSHGDTQRYRLTHGGEGTCPCERLGAHGCAVDRYVARDGTLTVVFHATDFETLQTVVADLREHFPELDIRKFVRGPVGETATDTALVDRRKLTERQLQVLETAYEMGYFERPREANATEVAQSLEISPSTFREHLAAAESKVLEDLL